MKDETSRPSGSGVRLTRERWIEAAMEILGLHGIDGVRVEQVAKALSVTKGSFYWHFKDRDELLEAILEHWRRKNTVDILEYVGSLESPLARLERLVRLPFHLQDTDPVGLPLRLWARHDERARKALQEVDELRLRMKAQIFIACGFAPEEARARAVLLYSYMRVAPTLVELEDMPLRDLCERLLLASAA
ncbi:TetR/AcrR family transcriptional regulator [Novosphingobium sp. PS1R-30]|uniref:TetR/AcrR family transcriptional regulator n=1 Tax=Novosphingobium anseongense TaxID=3133436 RepID=A0ABU8S1L0_9SPHN